MFAVLSHRFDSLPKLPKICYLFLLFGFLECAAGGIAYYLSLYLSTSTPLSKLQIGQVGSMVGLGSLIGALCSTFVTYKFNGKNIITLSLIFLGFGFFCMPQSINVFVIAACALVIGLATSIFLVTNNTLLLQNTPQDQISLRFAQSMKTVSENLGSSCSLLLIMFFAAQYYGQIFEIIGLFFMLFAISSMKFLNTSPCAREQSEDKGVTKHQANAKQLYLMIVAVFIAGIIYGQQRIAYPLFLNDTFASFTITATLFWLDPIIVTLFQVQVTNRVSSWNSYHLLALGGLLLGAGLFALTIVNSLGGVVLACLIFILGEMLFMPTAFVLCYESVGAERKGMATGAWRSAYASGLIVGPSLSGFLMEHYSYNACWLLAGMLGLLLCITFLAQKK